MAMLSRSASAIKEIAGLFLIMNCVAGVARDEKTGQDCDVEPGRSGSQPDVHCLIIAWRQALVVLLLYGVCRAACFIAHSSFVTCAC